MFEHWAHTDLTRLPDIKKMGNVFTQDSEANKIGVEVTKDGVPVTLVGMVKAWIVKPDGETITEQHNVGMSGNTAWVILPAEAYDTVGLLGIYLKLINGSTVTTLGGVEGYVYRSLTANII